MRHSPLHLKLLLPSVISLSLLTISCGTKSEHSSETSGLIATLAKVFGDIADNSAKKFKNQGDISAFIEGVSGDVFHELNLKAAKAAVLPYNIAMCRADNTCSLQSDAGLAEDQLQAVTVMYKELPFQLWAFRAGTFINNGRNGWDQWRLIGCHDLESGVGQKHVRFTNPAWDGSPANAKPGCAGG